MTTPTLAPTHTPAPASEPISIGEALTMLEQALDATNGAKAYVAPLDIEKQQPGTLGWKGRDGEPQVLISISEHGAQLLMSWSCHGPNGRVHGDKVSNREMLVACSMPSACQIAALPDQQGVAWLRTRAITGGEAQAVMFAFCALVSAVRAACFASSAWSLADVVESFVNGTPPADATGAKAP